MTSIIELAVDFLDKVANPAHGRQVNEEYSIRLGEISADENFRASLRVELERLRNPASLTPYGWMVVLNWSDAMGATIDPDLLIALCESWESAAFKARVIESTMAYRQVDYDTSTAGVRQFPDLWLRTLLTRAIQDPGYEREWNPEERYEAVDVDRHSRHAESLLMALISVESEITLSAASALLQEDWYGSRALLSYFWDRVEDLDEETAAAWVDRLSPPARSP